MNFDFMPMPAKIIYGVFLLLMMVVLLIECIKLVKLEVKAMAEEKDSGKITKEKHEERKNN